jgi:hypothetical protein
MFDSAKQKVHRADYHIADFNRQVDSFVLSKPNEFEIHSDPKTGMQTIRIRFLKQVPDAIPFIIADAIHNLRAALDHVAWELAAIGNGVQNRHTKFITGGDRQSFKGLCNGIETPSQWVKDAICTQEAFPGGRGHELYNLTELNNADKHTITAPVMRITGHPPIRIIRPDGVLMLTMEGNALMGGPGDIIPMVQAPAGWRVEWDKQADIPTSIFFSKPDGVVEPAWSMLRGFRISVGRAISEIEAEIQ